MSHVVYLAARYSRRLELCRYRSQLAAIGIDVNSRWLNGSHQLDNSGRPIGDDGEALVEEFRFESAQAPAPLREKFATDDRDDVLAASLLVAFTEVPRTSNSRGGRHVELGIAIGAGIPVVVIGPRENVFCHLPEVEHYDTWDAFLAVMRAVTA
jgi:hypothetical protein